MRVRSYLSWSQLDSFERGNYARDYIWGSFAGNKYTDFGQLVHSELEKPKSENELIEQLRLFLPDYPTREKEIKQEIEGVPCLGIFDGLDTHKKTFGDYKTSKNKWTQRKADTSGQFSFYALMLWKRYGWIPKRILIHWIETAEQDGQLHLTGNVQTIITKRSEQDLIKFYYRVKKAWFGIGELCDRELQAFF